MVSFTPRPLYSRDIASSTHWPQSQSGYGGKKKELHPHWESNPDSLVVQLAA
jgi:hypothetical protein